MIVRHWCKSLPLGAEAKISDSSPRLKDLVIRQEMNKLVTDLVDLDRVRSMFKMISLRRRYFAKRESILMQQRGWFCAILFSQELIINKQTFQLSSLILLLPLPRPSALGTLLHLVGITN